MEMMGERTDVVDCIQNRYLKERGYDKGNTDKKKSADDKPPG